MGKIVVYNSKIEDYSSHSNNFYIGRPSILSNPYTHYGSNSKLAKYICKTREEAIDAYKSYFHKMYNENEEFKKEFDTIYEKFKNGEDIYLQCFCKPLSCHGDYIAEMLQKRLIREYKQNKKASTN